jgi:hypothetical protein
MLSPGPPVSYPDEASVYQSEVVRGESTDRALRV